MKWNGMEWNGMEWCGAEWSGVEWSGITARAVNALRQTARRGGESRVVGRGRARTCAAIRTTIFTYMALHDMTVYTHLRRDPHDHHLYIYGINLHDTGDPRAASSLPHMALRGMAFHTTLNTGHLRRDLGGLVGTLHDTA